MHFWFETDEYGFVHALVDGPHGLQEVLADAMEPSPPGVDGRQGPCTYWVDYTLHRLFVVPAPGVPHSVAEGNMTYMELRGDHVYADVDYEPDTGQGSLIRVDELLTLLGAYRRAIQDACGGGAHREHGRHSHRPGFPEFPWDTGP